MLLMWTALWFYVSDDGVDILFSLVMQMWIGKKGKEEYM